MAPKQRLGTLVLTTIVLVAVAVGVTGWWLGIGPAGDETEGVQSAAEAQIDTTYPLVTGDSIVYRLPLPALIDESDIVIIATVEGRSEQWRRDGGGTDITFLGFDYFLSVERYLMGDGEPSVALQKPFAMEVADRKITDLFDSPNPIAIGGRYFFFLEGPEKGVLAGTADPFRFRIEDGLVRAESTMGVGLFDHDGIYLGDDERTFEHPFFPAKGESEFMTEVSALVTTAATAPR